MFLYLRSLVFVYSRIGYTGVLLRCDVIPTSIATLRQSNTALVTTHPGLSRVVSLNVSSLVVVGSIVLATDKMARAAA